MQPKSLLSLALMAVCLPLTVMAGAKRQSKHGISWTSDAEISNDAVITGTFCAAAPLKKSSLRAYFEVDEKTKYKVTNPTFTAADADTNAEAISSACWDVKARIPHFYKAGSYALVIRQKFWFIFRRTLGKSLPVTATRDMIHRSLAGVLNDSRKSAAALPIDDSLLVSMEDRQSQQSQSQVMDMTDLQREKSMANDQTEAGVLRKVKTGLSVCNELVEACAHIHGVVKGTKNNIQAIRS